MIDNSRAFQAFIAAFAVVFCVAILALFCAIYFSPRTGEPLEWFYLLVAALPAALSAALGGAVLYAMWEDFRSEHRRTANNG